MTETLTPIEEFNTALENAVLELNKTGRGEISLTTATFGALVEQFLSDPMGTAKLAAQLAGEAPPPPLQFKSDKPVTMITTSLTEPKVPMVTFRVNNVSVGIKDKTATTNEIALAIVQNDKKPHEVVLQSLAATPDIKVPVIGGLMNALFNNLKGSFVMAGLFDTVSAMAQSKKASLPLTNIWVDIVSGENIPRAQRRVNVVMFTGKDKTTKFEKSTGYAALKFGLEALSKF